MDQELLRDIKIMAKLGIAVLVLLVIYLFDSKVGHIIGGLFSALPGYIMPFLIALFLAIVIEPLIGLFVKRFRMGRGLATLISMVLVIGGLFGIIGLLVARLINELISIYQLLVSHSSDIGQTLYHTFGRIIGFYRGLNLPASVEQSLKQNLGSALGGMQDLTMAAAQGLGSFVAGLPNAFVVILIAIVATYFIAYDRPRLWAWVMRPLPDQWEDRSREVGSRLMDAFLGFIRAEGIMVLITIVQTIIGLFILRVPYALTMGLIIGACDIVPLVGPGIIYIPWIIWEIAKGNPGLALGLAIVWVTGILIRQFTEPKVIGKQVGLHPLATLVSLYVGMKAFGGIGIILGPVTVIFFLASKRSGAFDFIKLRMKRKAKGTLTPSEDMAINVIMPDKVEADD